MRVVVSSLFRDLDELFLKLTKTAEGKVGSDCYISQYGSERDSEKTMSPAKGREEEEAQLLVLPCFGVDL